MLLKEKKDNKVNDWRKEEAEDDLLEEAKKVEFKKGKEADSATPQRGRQVVFVSGDCGR